MRAQLWDKDFNAQILPYVDGKTMPMCLWVLSRRCKHWSAALLPEQRVSMRATYIRIGGKHVYSGGPYFPR